METLAQKIFGEYYGTPVDSSFVAEELQALEMGHAAGTLDAAQQRLYKALTSGGPILEDAYPRQRPNPSKFSRRLSAARAESAATEADYERGLAGAPPQRKRVSLFAFVLRYGARRY
jgi:hypothetical protein